jgi:hypothetical protein
MSTYISIDGHVGGRKHTCKQCSINRTQSCMFYNSDGSLTQYAFSCGYIERKEGQIQGQSYSYSLGKEHTVYHVKGFGTRGKHVWESFDTLTAARRLFRSLPEV